jgi:hypothetical protein
VLVSDLRDKNDPLSKFCMDLPLKNCSGAAADSVKGAAGGARTPWMRPSFVTPSRPLFTSATFAEIGMGSPPE